MEIVNSFEMKFTVYVDAHVHVCNSNSPFCPFQLTFQARYIIVHVYQYTHAPIGTIITKTRKLDAYKYQLLASKKSNCPQEPNNL